MHEDAEESARTKSQIAMRTLAIALMMAMTTETMAEMTASMPRAIAEMMEPCRIRCQRRSVGHRRKECAYHDVMFVRGAKRRGWVCERVCVARVVKGS
jgi:hypothetical protein